MAAKLYWIGSELIEPAIERMYNHLRFSWVQLDMVDLFLHSFEIQDEVAIVHQVEVMKGPSCQASTCRNVVWGRIPRTHHE